jgi:ribosomal protein S18 acetylase RimI-like enzyme
METEVRLAAYNELPRVNELQGRCAKKGFPRIELDMWSFNESALAFYEAEGFTTYRRYLEFPLE